MLYEQSLNYIKQNLKDALESAKELQQTPDTGISIQYIDNLVQDLERMIERYF